MNNKKQFLNTVLGYVFPVGSEQDPNNKKGLLKIAINSFKYGSKNYPNAIDYYRKLDQLGILSQYYIGREYSYILFKVPNQKLHYAKKLLDEILYEVKTTEEDLSRLKEQSKLDLKDIKTDPRGYADYEFENMVFGDFDPHGRVEGIDTISLSDICNMQELLQSKNVYLYLNQDKRLDGEIKKLKSLEIPTIDFEPDQRVKFIDKELPQKVLYLGYEIHGMERLDLFKGLISRSILYSIGRGRLFDKIREEKSVAYYIWALNEKGVKKSLFEVVAGISEDNIYESLNLIKEEFDLILKDDLSDDLETAKYGAKIIMRRIFDVSTALYDFLLKLALSGQYENLGYQRAIEMVEAVNEHEVKDFYKNCFKREINLLINGDLKDELKNDIKKLLNEW